jgi:DNA-directed RNA polymerase alpha subunit
MYKAPKRTLKIIKLKESGVSFKKIAEKYGITYQRARDIYIRYKERMLAQIGWATLDMREINALKKVGYHSLEEIKNNPPTIKIKNIGVKTAKEIKNLIKL